MLRHSRLILSASAMAVLIVATLPTTLAFARHSQGTSWSRAEDAHACTPTGARSSYSRSCHRKSAGDLPGSGDRDVWGHWGTYYGPMVSFP